MEHADRRLTRRGFVKAATGAAVLGTTGVASALPKPTQAAAEATARPAESFGSIWQPDVPRRLCETTRELARRAIAGEHGQSMADAAFKLDEQAKNLSENQRYALACQLVAEKAPLRVLAGERIVGSATLAEATRHKVPLMGYGSISHTTIGFHKVLPIGYRGLRRRIADRLARGGLDEKGVDVLYAMRKCLDAASAWHGRHMDLLADREASATGPERETYRHTRETLASVPENPPENFHQAVQSLWFMYAFQRLMGNWSGIGRIDEMLGPYLERDLAAGKITLDEAREILAHFWVKGCEWTGAPSSRTNGSGDAQFYQNIILAGVDAHGREVANDVTYLVLDIVEELHISDFPIAVRINRHTPARLLQRIAEVQRHGGGIVAVYNEEVVIEALVKFGYPLEEARTFTNDGCWELLIPGKTAFIYRPFDTLALLHDALGLQDAAKPAPDYASFDALYAAYIERLRGQIDEHHRIADGWAKNGKTSPLLSMFVEDCIERGRTYHDSGAHYIAYAPHAGGLANVANSLLVIHKLVYEDRYLTLPEFVRILRDDWKGQEPLRQLIGRRFKFYGNDTDEADAMVKRVYDDYTEMAGAIKEREGVLRPVGISTFGREIEWSFSKSGRKASPDGHHQGAVLATNFSPSPGTDLAGPTAVLKSYCKMDMTRVPNCATVELKVHPESVRGQAGVDAMVALMRSFVRLGGMFMHTDVVDSALLIDAQRHPEKHPNLSVRIAGWSARFATLNKHWQDMVIARTQQYL